jgi:chromosome segregation ATPase
MADMSFTQAADEVRKILKGFKAVEQVSDALEKAGSIQNAVKEAEAALAKINGEIAEKQATLDAANAAYIAIKDEAKKLKADTKLMKRSLMLTWRRLRLLLKQNQRRTPSKQPLTK